MLVRIIRGLRGVSVLFGLSGHFPDLSARNLSPVCAAERSRLSARPYGAVRLLAVLFCIGVVCLRGVIVASAMVAWYGRLAFGVSWLVSDTVAPLLHSSGPRVADMVVPPGFAW